MMIIMIMTNFRFWLSYVANKIKVCLANCPESTVHMCHDIKSPIITEVYPVKCSYMGFIPLEKPFNQCIKFVRLF